MRRKKILIPEGLASELISEAMKHYPRETGGVLLGITSGSRATMIVTELIAAGPNCVRKRTRFNPDGAWQRARIAERYEASGRTLAYLGDWHSHPEGNGPSGLDRATAKRIAGTEAARCLHPVFVIVTRVTEGWALRAYRFASHRFRKIGVDVIQDHS